MNKIVDIDPIDRKILDMLCNDARAPYQTIAKACEISGVAVHQRVSRMKRDGLIIGSEFILDPAALGFTTCAYIGIYLERAGMFKKVAESLSQISEITECHYTTGAYSMLVKLYARDNEHMRELLIERLQPIPGIARTETLISLQESIKRHIPVY